MPRLARPSTRLVLAASSLVALVALAAPGCGGNDEKKDNRCCINGEFYDCDDDEISSCTEPEGNKCERDSSRDGECVD